MMRGACAAAVALGLLGSSAADTATAIGPVLVRESMGSAVVWTAAAIMVLLVFMIVMNLAAILLRRRFERRDWKLAHVDAAARIDLYDASVNETLARLEALLADRVRSRPLWRAILPAYAERIAAHGPDGMEHVFFTNSGVEAIECGLKMVRKYHDDFGDPGRYRVITCAGAFHGRTELPALYSDSSRKTYAQHLASHKHHADQLITIDKGRIVSVAPYTTAPTDGAVTASRPPRYSGCVYVLHVI